MDRVKKVPMKTFKVLSELQEKDLNRCVKEILEVENLEHSKLASIIDYYQKMMNSKKRTQDIDKDLKQSKEDKEAALGELNSSSDSDSKLVATIKKVIHYDIHKSFNLDIKEDESKYIEDIKSKLHIDFTEEIDYIKSLLKESK
jgi:hypothetical protein